MSCRCTCTACYTGNTCDCPLVNCANKASIVVKDGQCSCECSTVCSSGHLCEKLGRPCGNGGTTYSVYDDDEGDYVCKCQCSSCYMGENCETLKPNYRCANGGTAEEKNGNCRCQCPVGFKGSQCEESDKTCANGGTFVSSISVCFCLPGFSGEFCQVTGDSIDDTTVSTTGASSEAPTSATTGATSGATTEAATNPVTTG